ncbi:hypothetical protein Gotri_017378 [Gossypium trilobum]|uniref:Uncharacterized protein n=1 Tax=Gossypium trilobum TaxID=34281 RepID=A0A7J9E737_9ROSI|nr:hypothetical protein [Gossypium trilobum]
MARGTVEGYGQAFVFSENQKLDWCNMFALGVEPPCIRNPNLWPLKPARLRYLTIIPKELRLKRDVFEEMLGTAVQAVRMNYYPQLSITLLNFS